MTRVKAMSLVVLLLGAGCEAAGDAGAAKGVDSGTGGSDAGRKETTGDATPGNVTPGDSTGSDSPIGVPSEEGSGQTGSIGSTPYCDEQQCADRGSEIVAWLAMPGLGVFRRFEGGTCGLVGIVGATVVQGWTCSCQIENDSDGVIYIGPDGAGCFAFSRGGACLYDESEYTPCTTGPSDPCPALCEELEARYAADDAATFDAEVRHSECAEGQCHFVLSIEQECYADYSHQYGQAFDCALSDDEILDEFLASQVQGPEPSCDEPGGQAGGTCMGGLPEPCVYRPAGEWQGILVCGPYPPCERPDGCGLALACIDNLCGACTSDAQCAPGEGCVLDHCMPLANIACRSRRDCPTGGLCVLTGITGGTARGNEDMRAYCLSASGGSP